jgi:hypothetical protein
MMGFWLLMIAAGGPVFGPAFEPMRVYEERGRWCRPIPWPARGGRTIVNHCNEGTAFYTCEQIVNVKSLALIVYTATDDLTKFHAQPVFPSGQAAGRGNLTIAGDHWTFLGSGTDSGGKQVFYRTENYFSGRDKIHFEQYESGDNKTWVKKNSEDEVRVQ